MPNTIPTLNPIPQKGHILWTNNTETAVRCRQCRQDFKVAATREQLGQWWIEGKLIQHVLSKTSPGDRELLISGTCSKCFDAMFNET